MCDKDSARAIFTAALDAVMPENVIPNSLSFENNILTIENQHFDLSDYDNVYLYGSGKASIEMARAAKKLLKEKIAAAMVVSNYVEEVEGLEVIESTHPIPSQKSVNAGKRLIEAFEGMGKRDFFIYLLSGGSSALIEQPIDGVSLEDFAETTKVLLHQGLAIEEINTIRKNLSMIKGGGLASKTDADGVVLVVSDVIGDDLQAIGSAPLLEDNSTFSDVSTIIEQYKIFDLLPKSVQYSIKDASIMIDKKPKHYPHFLIATNKIALEKASLKAEELGLSVKIMRDDLEGDVQEVASTIMKSVGAEKKSVLLFGGEATVQVKGTGNGGRNQELCLWMLKEMQDEEGITFLSAGTDGIDGNSDAAGAVVCKNDYSDSVEGYLENNDSYHYLKEKKALIMIGASGTNVMDIMIAIQ